MKPCTCKRCGYKWEPRKTDTDPRQCPYCKSPKWNIALRAIVAQKEAQK